MQAVQYKRPVGHEIERNDVQRLVLASLADRPYAMYLLLRIRDSKLARSWLHRQCKNKRIAVSGARQGGSPHVFCIAFTWQGLCELGLKNRVREETFIPEFRQGMNSPARARALGDTDTSTWEWGTKREPPIHMLCAVYVSDIEERAAWSNDGIHLRDLTEECGFECVRCVPSQEWARHAPRYEPFGFSDGISQPYIIGSDPAHASRFPLRDHIQPGEFLLGYPNEFGVLPATPHVGAAYRGDLPPVPLSDDGDLGKNGSFLVVRELEQNVEEFEKLPAEVAACMVGRWKDGRPLIWYPASTPIDRNKKQQDVASGDDLARPRDPSPDVADVTKINDFTFYPHDMGGLRCPLGSHIRRSNPRDSRTDPQLNVTPEDSIRLSNQHRILRRGRPFLDDKEREGLFFMCLNTNIDRQFEFVQQAWVNNAQFVQPSGEADPIAGAGNGHSGTFTMRSGPHREVQRGLASYVTVRGGAYFFMPGIKALNYLATL